MNITLKEITVRDLSDDYQDNNELGIMGYGGKLDIRPPYQREFVYKDHQRDAVINTVRRDFPLNVMYWSIRGDGEFEVIDGQQRTISICQYVTDAFSINGLGFCNLTNDQQDQILNYKLMIYLCEGTDSEKLEWFRTINIAGEKLFPQELRNAVYAGPWTADAKRYFSKNGCPAYGLASGYLNGHLNRQEYLETAIDWHARSDGLASIEDYLSKHQHDPNASALWLYFQSLIGWVKATFPNYRREMKGLDWGGLYNAYKDSGPFNTVKLEKRVADLMMDDEVQKKSGIYYYVPARQSLRPGEM